VNTSVQALIISSSWLVTSHILLTKSYPPLQNLIKQQGPVLITEFSMTCGVVSQIV